MGHVQDTPVSTSMVSNVCTCMKVHIVSNNLDQNKFSKSKIHILPNYEQTDIKTAIVACPVQYKNMKAQAAKKHNKCIF